MARHSSRVPVHPGGAAHHPAGPFVAIGAGSNAGEMGSSVIGDAGTVAGVVAPGSACPYLLMYRYAAPPAILLIGNPAEDSVCQTNSLC